MSDDGWDDDGWDDDDHDRFHPYMFAGCDACADRADWLERLHRDSERQDGTQ